MGLKPSWCYLRPPSPTPDDNFDHNLDEYDDENGQKTYVCVYKYDEILVKIYPSQAEVSE